MLQYNNILHTIICCVYCNRLYCTKIIRYMFTALDSGEVVIHAWHCDRSWCHIQEQGLGCRVLFPFIAPSDA